MLFNVHIYGQAISLESIGATSNSNLLVSQSPFSDANCSISGPLLVENDPDQTNGIFSDIGGMQEAAVPYSPLNDVTINQICIAGGYFSGCTPATFPDYIFTVYSDNAGPDTPIAGPFTISATHVITGTTLFGSDELGVTLDFPNVALTAGSTVWLSVVSTEPTAACRFFWEVSPTGNGSAFTQDDGANWTVDPATSIAFFLGEFVCPAESATLSGGPFAFCADDGIADIATGVAVTGGAGMNSTFVVTDDALNILAIEANIEDVDFEGLGAGTCLIHFLFFDDITGAAVGANAADLDGCFALSTNTIDVVRSVGCAVDAIPTMGEWGLISLGILFMIFGIVSVRQRETAFQA